MNSASCVTARAIAVLLLGFGLIHELASLGLAAVSATGNFLPPLPAAGGSIAGEVRIGIGNSNGDIFIATMTVNDGTVLADSNGIIGEMDGAFGDVLITGTTTAWNHSGQLTVGNAGWGSLTIRSAGRANVGDDMFIGRLGTGNGEVLLDGLTSRIIVSDDLEVGSAGVAYLQATDGSQIRSGDAVIGSAAGSDGHVLLADSPTQWNNTRDIVIGGAGIGRLDITLGAQVNQRTGIIGNSTGSFGTATVIGPQSNWSMTTDLNIGASGTGELLVSGGGQVHNRIGRIGSATSGRGSVTVSGARSMWQLSNELFVGNMGTGFLSIESSGLVNVTSSTTIGTRGRVNFDGGQLITTNLVNNGIITGSGEIMAPLSIGTTGEVRVSSGEHMRITGAAANAGRLEAIGGEVEFLSAATNSASTGQFATHNGLLRFQGGLTNQGNLVSVSGATNIFGSVTNGSNGSIVVAGDSTLVFYNDVSNAGLIQALPGSTIVFAQDLMLGSASSLAFELAGLEAGDDFAQVEVAGTAGLAGSLEIGLDSDYLPAAGDSFTLLASAGGISGSFTNTVLPSLPTGLSWLLGYSNSDVMLSVTAASLLTGDYNGNGTVEQADLDLVLLNWGAAGSPPPTGWTNDLPDGQIDQGELDGILLNWGNTGSAAMQGSLVPEPSSLVLAVTLVLALSYWFITARIGAAGTTPVSR